MHSTQNPVVTSSNTIRALMNMIQRAVVIDDEKLELILAAILARGHILLEDIPGIGKTLVAKAIATSMQASFKRVQCTPDLLPSDITGSAIYNQRDQRFEFIEGPLFANIVLVDEINRASPRTQSSLLEAMAEGQVSSDGTTRQLPEPFFIIATQNPIEMAGTFPLPEAQLDRFLIMLDLGYPEYIDEITILEREEHSNPLDALSALISMDDIIALQEQAKQVDVVRHLKEYIVQINQATRTHPDVVLGISPRGGVAMQRCAQALALIRGRDFVTPDDIKTSARAVGGHRILSRDRKPETAKAVLDDILSHIRVPVE